MTSVSHTLAKSLPDVFEFVYPAHRLPAATPPGLRSTANVRG